MTETDLMNRITVDPRIFGGKAISLDLTLPGSYCKIPLNQIAR